MTFVRKNTASNFQISRMRTTETDNQPENRCMHLRTYVIIIIIATHARIRYDYIPYNKAYFEAERFAPWCFHIVGAKNCVWIQNHNIACILSARRGSDLMYFLSVSAHR